MCPHTAEEVIDPMTKATQTVLDTMLANKTVKVVPLDTILRNFAEKLKEGKRTLSAKKRELGKPEMK